MIKIDTNELDKLVVEIPKVSKSIEANAKKQVSKSAFTIERNAKQNLTQNKSVVTGHLRRSIATKVNGFEAEVHTSNVSYARGLEFGNKPHIIRPKNKKALFWKGAKHPVKFVKHPGNRPKPFLIPAFEKEKDKFVEELEKIIKW